MHVNFIHQTNTNVITVQLFTEEHQIKLSFFFPG